MADERKDGVGGLLDLERELTCSICTDIFFQPLTLLDCLHTFCGGCLKEWFAWQAEAAARKRRVANPYTCPSCRETVRGTKADWRLTALLEGYLKANPGKGKTEEEKEETRRHYAPGENILPEVKWDNDTDSEDERLLADVMDLSMANVDPETARRRRERADRVQQRQRRNRPTASSGRRESEETGRTQPLSQRAAQPPQREGPGERHVEHQSSLRSLLSGSEVDSQEMQQEILHSIYSEGLLDGIDVDNLTPEQEDELTERIAEAYRRRQRQRERSRNRERQDENTASPGASTESPRRIQAAQTEDGTTQQQTPARTRPPIARPHLFEQSSVDSSRGHRRSGSSTGQANSQSERTTARNEINPASRSATDLSNSPGTNDSQRTRERASSTNTRSTTDPDMTRNVARHARNNSATLRPDSVSPRTRSFDTSMPTSNGRQNRASDHHETPTQTPPNASPRQAVRSAQPISRVTPEPLRPSGPPQSTPSITCTRCHRADIQNSLHYNCIKCHNGNYNLCLACYRSGQGCDHWFGFGFRAMDRWRTLAPPEGWPRNYDYPHVLQPRRWVSPAASSPTETLEQGAFCESCLAYAGRTLSPTRPADRYWYCEICLEGAWGFCNACTLQGKHCTHPLLPLTRVSLPSSSSSSLPSSTSPPASPKPNILPVPHLAPNSHALLIPPDPVSCDKCAAPIPPSDSRYHCYQCSDGDYDLCNPCYSLLARTGQIAAADGAQGWRRCPRGHRMAIVQHRPTPYGGGAGYVRVTVADPVGGWRLRDEGSRALGPAPPSTTTSSSSSSSSAAPTADARRLLATWSWFPAEGHVDELVFPRNAEIREAEGVNEDWSVGVYMGRVGVFPSNHVRQF